MSKRFNRCDFFILLWILYYLQGILYSPGIINKFLQFIMILIAGVETIKLLSIKIHSSIIKSTLYLLLMYCFYGGWIIIFGDGVTFKNGNSPADYLYLQVSLNSLLPIFMFYNYSRKGLLTERRIIIYAIVFIIQSIILYMKVGNSLTSEMDLEETTNNIGYNFVSLIPLIFFFHRKPFIQYILLGICGMYIIMSFKRGAILIGILSIIEFLYSNLKEKTFKRKIITYILTIGVIICAKYYISTMLQTSDYFVQRLEQTIEGDSSGRDLIYTYIWNSFINEPNPFYFLFGHGANATIGVSGNYAHQDWLEILYNNGVLGILILSGFFVNLTKATYNQRNKFPKYMYHSFIVLSFITFSKTIFSASIQDILVFQSLLIGYFAYFSTLHKDEINNLLVKI